MGVDNISRPTGHSIEQFWCNNTHKCVTVCTKMQQLFVIVENAPFGPIFTRMSFHITFDGRAKCASVLWPKGLMQLVVKLAQVDLSPNSQEGVRICIQNPLHEWTNVQAPSDKYWIRSWALHFAKLLWKEKMRSTVLFKIECAKTFVVWIPIWQNCHRSQNKCSSDNNVRTIFLIRRINILD